MPYRPDCIHLADLPFAHGDIVYLITDPEQEARQITGILIEGQHVQYQLTLGAALVSYHQAVELACERNLKIVYSLN